VNAPISSVSALTPAPGPVPPQRAPGPGTAATPEQLNHDIPRSIREAMQRGSTAEYGRWISHVSHVGACTRPIRLSGRLDHVDTRSGEVTGSTPTATMPDGVVYTACGNRRATVCPACAETYRADTYQLVRAGLVGGKNVPASVAGHPCVFLTATAPSFGPVHSTRAGKDGHPRTCRPRRHLAPCRHGRSTRCMARHQPGDPMVGQPLCLECYDHDHHVVWNVLSGELWRRTTLKAAKALKRLGARASFAKVAEMQARGAVHFHALIRLDALDPDLTVTPDGDLIEIPAPPPVGVGLAELRQILIEAFTSTAFASLPHLDRPEGWAIAWGAQLDVRHVREPVPGRIDEGAVAGYLAKYATKATETTGHTSARLNAATVADHMDAGTHIGRLIASCWHLGRPGHPTSSRKAAAPTDEGRLSYTRLRRWAHMLGFGGHFSTKSRRYSTTLGALRRARHDYRRDRQARLDTRFHDSDASGVTTTLLVGTLTFAGSGWHTTGDALLATTAAAHAREHRTHIRQELRATTTRHLATAVA